MSQASEQIARQYANAGLTKREFGRLYWVTVYGALGDGVTDDSAAFAAALNAINQAGGGTLWIPYSDDGYLLTNEVNLTLSAGTKIVIMGNKAKLLARLSEPVSEKGVFNLTGDVVISGENWTGTNELYMQNVTVEGNATVTGNRNAFNITGIAKVDLQDCRFSGMSIGGALIKRCAGVQAIGCDSSENMYDGLRFADCNGVSILGGNYSDNGEVSPTNGYGVTFSAGDFSKNRNIVISGILAFNNKRKGVDIHCGTNVKITDNVIKGFGYAGIYATNEAGGNIVKDISITGNDIEQTADFTGSAFGIQIGAFGSGVTDTGSFIVNNNKILKTNANTASNAINITNPDNEVIKYIEINGNIIENGCSSGTDIIFSSNASGQWTKKVICCNNILHSVSARRAINITNIYDANVSGNLITIDSGTVEYGIFLLESTQSFGLVEGNQLAGAATYTTPINVPQTPRMMLRSNKVQSISYRDTYEDGRAIYWDTSAPTVGYHRQGSIVWNKNAATGQPLGWACTVTGTPGTFRPMPNLT